MRVLSTDYPRPLNLLALGAGGHLAAACGVFPGGGPVEWWNLAGDESRDTYQVGGWGPRSLGFAGPYLLIGEQHRLSILDPDTGEPQPGPRVPPGHTELAVIPGGNRFFTTHSVGAYSSLVWWEMAGPRLRETWTIALGSELGAGSPALAPAADRAAFRALHYPGRDRPRQTIALLDPAARRVLVEIPTDAAEPVQQLAFTADGSKLLARTDDRVVRVFDASTGEPAGELVHKGRPFVTGLAVHPGGQAIATSRNDGTAWFWDPVTLREIKSFDWKLGKLVSVAFSPDGTLAAAGTEDGQVIVWDVDL